MPFSHLGPLPRGLFFVCYPAPPPVGHTPSRKRSVAQFDKRMKNGAARTKRRRPERAWRLRATMIWHPRRGTIKSQTNKSPGMPGFCPVSLRKASRLSRTLALYFESLSTSPPGFVAVTSDFPKSCEATVNRYINESYRANQATIWDERFSNLTIRLLPSASTDERDPACPLPAL